MRPVATMASGRTALTSSGMISGVGLASAKMIGFGPIVATIAAVRTLGADRPRKMSAPTIASARVRALPRVANCAL